MCSICGGLGVNLHSEISKELRDRSKDRGRGDMGMGYNTCGWVCNARGIPTTEVIHPTEPQPVGINHKIVFNGIISNDKDLGVKDGEADTSVLPRILNTSSDLSSFAFSLVKLEGSFAIAVLKEDDIFLACNYKPIWYTHDRKYFSSLRHHLIHIDKNPVRMTPYTAMSLKTGESATLLRVQSDKAIVIASGGLDSTVVASYVVKKHREVILLHFDYGCKASEKEKDRIEKIAKFLACDYIIIPISKVYFNNSSLLKKDADISKGITGAEYAHEWVPARNLVMLSLATAFAENNVYGHIYIGTNLEEGGAYPDNEEQFLLDFNNLLYGAVNVNTKIELHTPLGGMMKHEIVKYGMKFNTPFDLTWSCYKDGEVHCGDCGPCFMRREAFKRNNLIDPVKFKIGN